MRILQFRSENVMRLHCVAIKPDRSIVRITGANGSGKSSILNSIFFALAGASHHPSQPIRAGAHKATIRLDLGETEAEVSVIRRFTPSGTSLDVEAPNGAVFKKPQALLDQLIGQLTFDPLAFARLSAKAQLEQLRSLVTVDVDLDALDADSQRAYEARTEVNRRIVSLGERVKTLAADVHEEMDVTPLGVSAMVDQMQHAVEHNADRERAMNARIALAREIDTSREMAVEKRAVAARLVAEAERLEEFVTDRTAMLAAAEPVPDAIDTALLRIAINDGGDENARRAAEARARTAHRSAVDALAAAEGEATELTAIIADNARTKAEAIAAAEMPVAGLSFGDGEITYNGIPFAQASQAEQIRVATAIGMALNPKLRILCIRDGSLLDPDSLALVEQMAERHDFQVWLEVVDTSGTVGISMVDGAVAAVDGVPVDATEEVESAIAGA